MTTWLMQNIHESAEIKEYEIRIEAIRAGRARNPVDTVLTMSLAQLAR